MLFYLPPKPVIVSSTSSPNTPRCPWYLNKRYANSIGFQVALELVTDLANELMGYHKNQDVSTCCSLDDIWDSHLWGEQVMCLLDLS